MANIEDILAMKQLKTGEVDIPETQFNERNMNRLHEVFSRLANNARWDDNKAQDYFRFVMDPKIPLSERQNRIDKLEAMEENAWQSENVLSPRDYQLAAEEADIPFEEGEVIEGMVQDPYYNLENEDAMLETEGYAAERSMKNLNEIEDFESPMGLERARQQRRERRMLPAKNKSEFYLPSK